MALHLHHIGVKVDNIQQTSRLLCSTGGFEAEPTTYYPEVGMQIGFINLSNTLVELLQPMDQNCPIANVENGLHHLAFEVENLEAFHTDISQTPSFCTVEPIKEGRHGRIFFFQMKAMPGLWYECMEKTKTDDGTGSHSYR